jgi:hypothetical protein
MKNLSISTDKMAISLSLACVLHCLAVPLFIVFFPSFAIIPLEGEAFHFWMIVAVIPVSIYALALGCKKHKMLSFMVTGLLGLSCLVVAILLAESHLGETGEKVLTVLGAALIAFSHARNFSLCQKLEQCPCPVKADK